MRRTLGPLLLIALALLSLLWLRPHHPPSAEPATSSATPSTDAATTVPSTTPTPVAATATPSTGPKTTTRPTPAAPRPLSGRPLAEAWLTGYLTRSSRDDTRWVQAVTPLTTSELVADLQASGPDAVGLTRLTSWRVTKIQPYQAVDQPVDTPTRVTLAYAASVTDGRHTSEKPFLLTSYLQADGRWLITSVDQPYSSEG